MAVELLVAGGVVDVDVVVSSSIGCRSFVIVGASFLNEMNQ